MAKMSNAAGVIFKRHKTCSLDDYGYRAPANPSPDSITDAIKINLAYMIVYL
jgi:hypothetical protein